MTEAIIANCVMCSVCYSKKMVAIVATITIHPYIDGLWYIDTRTAELPNKSQRYYNAEQNY